MHMMNDERLKLDEYIVKGALGDDSLFEILVQRYEKKLFRYISRISGLGKETIEDLLQEIFIKVYQNLNDYDDEFPFSSWIYRIAHNVTVSYLRNGKQNVKFVSIEDGDSDKNLIDLLPDKSDLPKDFDKRYISKKVHEALIQLPEDYRDVLVLFYLEEKSYKEISDILKRPINSVSVMINRAKLKLKPELESLN